MQEYGAQHNSTLKGQIDMDSLYFSNKFNYSDEYSKIDMVVAMFCSLV